MDVCKELKLEKKPHTFSQKVDCPNTFIMIVFPRSDFEKENTMISTGYHTKMGFIVIDPKPVLRISKSHLSFMEKGNFA